MGVFAAVLCLCHVSDVSLIDELSYDQVEINYVYSKYTNGPPKKPTFQQVICWTEIPNYDCKFYDLDRDKSYIVTGSQMVIEDWEELGDDSLLITKKSDHFEVLFYSKSESRMVKLKSKLTPIISHTYNDVEVDHRYLWPDENKKKTVRGNYYLHDDLRRGIFQNVR